MRLCKFLNKGLLNLFVRYFLLIFFVNLFSIWPYRFSLTSHLCFIFTFSFIFWISLNLFRSLNSFNGFVLHIVPLGTPVFLVFFIFIIEMIRNFIRPITLRVRLIANVLSGHLLIVLISSIVNIYRLAGILSFLLFTSLVMVELLVSFIQSYIFCTLSCLYYSEIF